MYPQLLASPRITSYGLLLLAGLVAGWVLARRQARRNGIEPAHIDLLAPLLVAAGLSGAALLGCESAAPRLEDGHFGDLALYGALLAAVALGIGYARWARLPLGRLGDALAAPVAVGIACGRVGCFLAGCCWGKTCAARGLWAHLAVTFPAGSPAHYDQIARGLLPAGAARSLPVYPVQLVEAVGAALLAGLILLAARRRRVWGESFLLLGLGYAALRFATEFLRADSLPTAGGLTQAQHVALVTAGVCAALWLVRRRLARHVAALQIHPLPHGLRG